MPWSYYRRKLHKASGSSLAKTKETAVSFHRKKRKKRQAAIARYLFVFFFARNYSSLSIKQSSSISDLIGAGTPLI